MPECLSGWGSLRNEWENFKSGAKQAAGDVAASATSFWAKHGDKVVDVAIFALSEGRARGGAAPEMRWPSAAAEMDELLGMRGTRVPDGPGTPGRGKVIWKPNSQTKIIFEQHPYDVGAPDWHRGPHWHLDTPGAEHRRYVPGDEIPGQ